MSDELDFGGYTDPKQLAPTLTEGECTFKIKEVVPKQSKGGNPMLVVTMSVTDVNGMTLNVDDYLVATPGDEAGMKRLKTKIYNISRAIGKPELYAEGASKIKPIDLLGNHGKCLVKTQSGGDYPDRSTIAKYLPSEKLEAAERAELANKQIAELDDEELPF